ncbi:hypothetical protein C1H46_020975 [Malus baccata]|uniref:Uncharacterized protein n=1 Tax=Malus baccata TaxID=106549 RepID=A0A540M3Y5_MALBA|nr:hypothetical protein C1H46_020975 [Malus baccata]
MGKRTTGSESPKKRELEAGLRRREGFKVRSPGEERDWRWVSGEERSVFGHMFKRRVTCLVTRIAERLEKL